MDDDKLSLSTSGCISITIKHYDTKNVQYFTASNSILTKEIVLRMRNGNLGPDAKKLAMAKYTKTIMHVVGERS